MSGWPPLEHDDYYGVVYVAVAVGHAPDNYAETEQARAAIAGEHEGKDVVVAVQPHGCSG